MELEPDGRLRWVNNPIPSEQNWISLNGIFFSCQGDGYAVELPLQLGEPEGLMKRLYDKKVGQNDPVEFYSPLVHIRCPKLMQEKVRDAMEGVPRSTLRYLARYIHEGNCRFAENDGDDVFALLESRNMLDSAELHQQCEFWIQTTLKRDPWSILKLALKNHQEEVKIKAFTYLALNRNLIGEAPARMVREKTGDANCGSDFGDFLYAHDEVKLKSLASNCLAIPILKPWFFARDLGTLFHQRYVTGDCVLVLGLLQDGEKQAEDNRPRVRAHKLILASRNEFFRRKLTSLLGSFSKTVFEVSLAAENEQCGFSVDALEVLLLFLYTGHTYMIRTPKDALLLLAAADYHAISASDPNPSQAAAHASFLGTCKTKLLQGLNVNNCLELLELAWSMGEEQGLFEQPLGFVVSHIKEIAATQEAALAALDTLLFHRILIRKMLL